MSDQNTPRRVFKIGSVHITEDASMAGLSNEQVKEILKRTYPEVAHATIRETQLEDGTLAVSYIAQPGRKG